MPVSLQEFEDALKATYGEEGTGIVEIVSKDGEIFRGEKLRELIKENSYGSEGK